MPLIKVSPPISIVSGHSGSLRAVIACVNESNDNNYWYISYVASQTSLRSEPLVSEPPSAYDLSRL